MNLVEERWQSLNFVDHHPAMRRSSPAPGPVARRQPGSLETLAHPEDRSTTHHERPCAPTCSFPSHASQTRKSLYDQVASGASEIPTPYRRIYRKIVNMLYEFRTVGFLQSFHRLEQVRLRQPGCSSTQPPRRSFGNCLQLLRLGPSSDGAAPGGLGDRTGRDVLRRGPYVRLASFFLSSCFLANICTELGTFLSRANDFTSPSCSWFKSRIEIP